MQYALVRIFFSCAKGFKEYQSHKCFVNNGINVSFVGVLSMRTP